MRHFTQWIALRLAAIGACAVLAASVYAQGTILTIKGPVVAVDQQQATIQVQDESQGRTFVIQLPGDSPKTLLRRNGQQISLQDVQVGQTVQIRHEESGGRYIVQEIEVLPTVAATTQIQTGKSTTTQVVTPAAPATITVPPATAPTTTMQIETDPGMVIQTPVTPIAPAAPLSVVSVKQRWTPADKLTRGLGNGLFGFLEIPRQIFNTSQEDSWLAGLTVGVFKGVGYSVARMGTGVYEIVTFPIPLPEDYRPLIRPEYPWEDDGPTYLG